MAGLCTKTLTAISLALIFPIYLAAAVDFTLNSPGTAEINSSFTVSLSASVSEDYDVKIFVQDNDTQITISEIYSGGWKNPFYYLKSVFPSKSEFEIRVISYSNNPVLCARLRKTNSSTFSEKCSSIEINFKDNGDKEENKTAEEENENASPVEKTYQESPDFALPENASPVENALPVKDENERIVLNAKKETVSGEVFITRQEKTRLFMLYGFTILSVIIIVLISLRKL